MPEHEEKQSKLEKTLTGIAVIIHSAVTGAASSFFNPFFTFQLYQNIKKGRGKVLAYHAMTVSALASYIAGIGFIAYNLIENPSNPLNYIPLLTNTIGGLLLYKSLKN